MRFGIPPTQGRALIGTVVAATLSIVASLARLNRSLGQL